jgi:hypothetical protein
LEVAGQSNASLAVKTSTTSATNKDGTVTVTTTTTVAAFSTKEGNLGQFLGAATQTNTMTYNPNDSFTVNPGQNSPITPISLDAARKTIGYDAVRQAASVSPDMAYHFARALGSDMYHHPIRYAAHAAGFALPFMGLGSEIEGLITAGEALHPAGDLNHEMQGGNQ